MTQSDAGPGLSEHAAGHHLRLRFDIQRLTQHRRRRKRGSRAGNLATGTSGALASATPMATVGKREPETPLPDATSTRCEHPGLRVDVKDHVFGKIGHHSHDSAILLTELCHPYAPQQGSLTRVGPRGPCMMSAVEVNHEARRVLQAKDPVGRGMGSRNVNVGLSCGAQLDSHFGDPRRTLVAAAADTTGAASTRGSTGVAGLAEGVSLLAPLAATVPSPNMNRSPTGSCCTLKG